MMVTDTRCVGALCGLVALYVSPLGVAQEPCYEDVIAPASLEQGDCFGLSFSSSGNVLVAAAQNRTVGTSITAGVVYVHERRGGAWVEVQQLTSGDPVPEAQRFGSRVLTDGVHLFVQCPRQSMAVVPPGGSTVHVYENEGGTWVLQQRIFDSQNLSGTPDNFGVDMCIDEAGRLFLTNLSGDTVHVFEKFAGNWVETARVTEADLGPGMSIGIGSFGYRVDAHDNRFAVTHWGAGSLPAHVFEFDGSQWNAIAQLESSPPGLFETAPIAIRDDVVIVGAQFENAQAGAAWVFEEGSGGWVNTLALRASDESAHSRFGHSLSLNDDFLAVGAPARDGGTLNEGAVYLFEPSVGGWSEGAIITSLHPVNQAALGSAVQVGNDRLFSSAPGDHLAYDGSVSEFRLSRSVGLAFGESQPNSTGVGATLSAQGSAVVGHNCMSMTAQMMPPGQFGYFLMSDTQGAFPLPGGSEGVLFLGLPLVRFSGHVLVVGPGGDATFAPDLSALPQATVISAGETWNFQMWFRDMNSGATSNTTNGLAITFETPSDPAVQFPSTLVEREEATLQLPVMLTLSQAAAHDVSVPYTTGGSATYGVDWRVEEPNPIVIPAGTTSLEMTIVIAGDAQQEDDETAIVTLVSPTGGVLGTASEFTLTIRDDD